MSYFLTYKQYQYLGIQEILAKLIRHQYYYLALKICDYLKISPEFVLVEWACEKIRKSTSISDETLRDQIRENLKFYPTISYRNIATVAYDANKKHLATMLLEFETHLTDKVVCCTVERLIMNRLICYWRWERFN